MSTCDGCIDGIPRDANGYHREPLEGVGLEYTFYCVTIDPLHIVEPDDTNTNEEFPF